jgi:hypothetical protein
MLLPYFTSTLKQPVANQVCQTPLAALLLLDRAAGSLHRSQMRLGVTSNASGSLKVKIKFILQQAS